MPDVLEGFIVALIIVSLLQPNAPRLFGAVVFSGLIAAHYLMLSHLDGLLYYGSAALFDLLFMVLTCGINPAPKMVFSLYKICMCSMIINCVGWVLWISYEPPIFYNLAYLGLCSWALAVLLRRNRSDVGGFELDRWGACFRFDPYAWSGYLNRGEGKI